MAKFFGNFFKTVIPTVRADDEEVVNPQEILQGKCDKIPAIAALKEKMETCTARVNSKTETTENCAEELFDYLDALNDCVAKDLTSKLK